MIKKIIYKLSENPFISDCARKSLLFSISNKKIKNFLTPQENETILELGCGTGRFSTTINSSYVGVDIDKKHIFYAHNKYSSNNKKFIFMDGIALGLKDNSFDKSMFVQSLHHVPDDIALSILRELSRVTKKYIYIVDWTPFKYNIIGMFFQSHDRGKYIRTFEEQTILISSVLHIINAYTSRSGQITSTYFLCDTEK